MSILFSNRNSKHSSLKTWLIKKIGSGTDQLPGMGFWAFLSNVDASSQLTDPGAEHMGVLCRSM